MDWTAAIDLYCERVSMDFWAEPANAWSNLAFPAAVLWAAIAARRRGGASAEYWALVWLAALVGLGSFLFHTFSNVWSEYADTIPIWSFVAVTIFVALGRVTGLRPGPLVLAGLVATCMAMIVFVTATDPHRTAPMVPDPLNGSGQYAPALIALAAFSAFAWLRKMPIRNLLLAALLAFLAALVFRSIDLRVCSEIPVGTHFLWHLMIALMVGFVLMVMLKTDPCHAVPKHRPLGRSSRTE
jgi:hypothetical protein